MKTTIRLDPHKFPLAIQWVTFVHTRHLHICRCYILTQKQHKSTSLLIYFYFFYLHVNISRTLHGQAESTGVVWLNLSVCFSVGGGPHRLMFKLLVFVNKFIEETVMGSADFFSRWKQLLKVGNSLSLPYTHIHMQYCIISQWEIEWSCIIFMVSSLRKMCDRAVLK